MIVSATRRARLVFGILFLLLASNCGGPPGVIIIGTAQAPGADGLVDAQKRGDTRSSVSVHMERLPAPEQLGSGSKYYLVWFTPSGGKPIRAGALAYKPENRTGDLVKACAFQSFRVTITAEASEIVPAPSELVVAERAVTAE
jgi:hypothetical protein